MRNQSGLSVLILIVVLVLLVGLGAGGYLMYQKKLQENQPPAKIFDNVNLSEETVAFTYRAIPGLYKRLFRLNRVITLIDIELERLSELETGYPSQKQIIDRESAMWVQTKQQFTEAVADAEKQVETFYVAYTVNNTKGRELIKENASALTDRIDSVIKTASPVTGRLKTAKKKTFKDKLKELF